MRIIAHRGASLLAVENTAAAFSRAREVGADAVELDVRCCGSGEAVVFHDATLQRLARDPRRIDRVALSLLRRVDLGGERICTLEEAFEAVGPDLQVHVELKVDAFAPTGLEAVVAQVITRLAVGERTCCSSFHPVALHRMRALVPKVPRALLFGTEQAAWWRFGAQGIGAGLAALHPEQGLATRRWIAAWHRLGMRVNVWTVDRPEVVRRLARAGADGVITNDPVAARSALV